VAIFQKDAGLVDAALGNSTHLQLARGNGAVVIDRCPVTALRRNQDSQIEVGNNKDSIL
jgi:sarcosine oxidase